MKIGIVSSVFNPNITEQMRIKADQRAMRKVFLLFPQKPHSLNPIIYPPLNWCMN